MHPTRSERGSANTPEEATALVRAMLGAGELTAEGDGFAYDQWSFAGDGFTLGRIASHGGDVHLSIARPADLVGVRVSEGALTLRGTSGVALVEAGDCALLEQHRATELSWTSVRAEFYSLAAPYAQRLLSGASIAQRLTPRSAALGRFWYLLAQLISGQVLPNVQLRCSETIWSTMLDAFAAATIETFDVLVEAPHSEERYAEVLARSDAYLRAHLVEHVAMREIAQAVGLSLRGLQLAYERSGSEMPSGHLRRLRLESARSALLLGAASTTVTRTAHGIGYSNLGRFSAHYRDVYAESPAATLRRARQRRT